MWHNRSIAFFISVLVACTAHANTHTLWFYSYLPILYHFANNLCLKRIEIVHSLYMNIQYRCSIYRWRWLYISNNKFKNHNYSDNIRWKQMLFDDCFLLQTAEKDIQMKQPIPGTRIFYVYTHYLYIDTDIVQCRLWMWWCGKRKSIRLNFIFVVLKLELKQYFIWMAGWWWRFSE